MLDLAEVERTGNRYADQYVVSAERLGLETELIDRGTAVIRGNGKRLTVRAAILGCNNAIASRISSNKFVCNTRLRLSGFRVPDWSGFSTRDRFDADALYREVMVFAEGRFPVVLKPVRGQGGLNVHAGITDPAELAWSLRRYFDLSIGDFLCEKHIEGRHYRVKLFDGELVAAVERFLPAVRGDGRSTIRMLVDAGNEERQARRLPGVTETERMNRHLARQGLTLDSVLQAGRELTLGAECNLALGGQTRLLPPQSVPGPLVDYLAAAARCCGLRWVGVDYIVDDLQHPDAHERGCINEMNSAPVPREYRPERTLDEYLDQATHVLKAYFDLP